MEPRNKKNIFIYLVYLFTLVLPFLILEWLSPLTGEQTIGNDYPMFSITQQMELQYSFEHGTWPLYIPGFAGGRAAAALTLGQMYHPQPHLAAHIPGYWKGDALRYNTLLRLISLGFCHLVLLVLLRRLGLSMSAAFLASLVTVYNLRMLDAFRFGASLESYTAQLFLCAAMAFYCLKPTRVRGPLLIVGATFLLVCGGHPQFMYYGLLGCGLIGMVLPYTLQAIAPHLVFDKRHLLRFYLVVALSVILGICLSAAYIVPLYFDFVVDTGERIAHGYGWAIGYTDSWGGALNNIFHPLHVNLEACFGGSVIIVVPFLIPLAWIMRLKVPKIIVFLAGFMVFLILLSLARDFLLYKWYWTYFPLASSYRIPGRVMFMMPVFIMFTLAFILTRVDKNIKLMGRELPLSVLSMLAILGSIAYLIYHFFIFPSAPRAGYPYLGDVNELPEKAISLVTWLGLLTLVLTIFYGLKTRIRPILGFLLIAAVLIQLGTVLHYGTWKTHDRTTATLERMDKNKVHELRFRHAPGYKIWSNSVREQRENTYLEKDKGKFYRRWISIPDSREMFSALRKLRLPNNIIVQGFNDARKPSKTEVQKPGLDTVTLKRVTFNQAIFEADTQAEGFFNFTELDHSRWNAFVDGKPVKIYRANGNEQAVFMLPGKHEIEFRFVSPASTVGMIISLVILAGLLISACFVSIRRVPVSILLSLCSIALTVQLFFWWQGSILGGDNLGTRYRWTSRQFPPQDNLAFGMTAKMSSIQDYQNPVNHYAGIGIDGKRTGDRVQTDHRQKSHWWQVDLGKEYRIEKIVVYDGGSKSTKNNLPLKVLLSRDGASFKEEETVAERGKGYPFRILINGRAASFVRLQSSTEKQLSFHEVEVYEFKH